MIIKVKERDQDHLNKFKEMSYSEKISYLINKEIDQLNQMDQ